MLAKVIGLAIVLAVVVFLVYLLGHAIYIHFISSEHRLERTRVRERRKLEQLLKDH